MRAYLIAFGLTALVIGLPLLLSGEVGIGCTVTNHGGTTTYSDCAGAHSPHRGGGDRGRRRRRSLHRCGDPEQSFPIQVTGTVPSVSAALALRGAGL